MKEFAGKPVVIIFYLGHACLHCAEQLQAFGPKYEEFQKAGIEMVAVSTDDLEGLKISIDTYGDEPMPIPLVSNDTLDVFKQWRVYDDFEDQPLHGTFVIDPEEALAEGAPQVNPTHENRLSTTAFQRGDVDAALAVIPPAVRRLRQSGGGC